MNKAKIVYMLSLITLITNSLELLFLSAVNWTMTNLDIQIIVRKDSNKSEIMLQIIVLVVVLVIAYIAKKKMIEKMELREVLFYVGTALLLLAVMDSHLIFNIITGSSLEVNTSSINFRLFTKYYNTFFVIKFVLNLVVGLRFVTLKSKKTEELTQLKTFEVLYDE
jgi:hypothetical protein